MGGFYSNKTDVAIFIANLCYFSIFNKNATKIEGSS